MDIIRGLANLHSRPRGCVATIGNFDGVHLGHQEVLKSLAARGGELGLPVAAVVFEPQPQEYFAPAGAPPRLTRLREKLAALRSYGVDRALVLRFDAKLAGMEAEAFAGDVLLRGIAPRYLVVGDDFRFGKARAGDFAMLKKMAAAHGCEVASTPSYLLDGVRVSSTRVREALAAGDLHYAARLLGRPYAMCGRVVRGDARGRTVGFPTANIAVGRHAVPVSGVYIVEVAGVGELPWQGVANVGTRPTVDGTVRTLEVHLLDYAGDLYGRQLEVKFLEKLRDERRFASLDALVEQIGRDVQRAREYFAARAPR